MRTLQERSGDRLDAVLLTCLVGLGCAAMLARPALAPLPLAERAVGLAAIAAAILVAAVAVPVPRAPRHLDPAWALGLGVLAVAIATASTGPPVGVPWAGIALPISLLAAVAEEALFRRVLFAALAPRGAFLAVAGTAVLFAAVHIPLYGWAAFPVDLGAGLLFGWQRHAAGTWTVPAATHAFANALAMLG